MPTQPPPLPKIKNVKNTTQLSRFPRPRGTLTGDLARYHSKVKKLEDESKRKSAKIKQMMPDAIAKHCYACGLPFTMIRRKHHCRLCGNIFCNADSSQTIDGTWAGYGGFVRVCDWYERMTFFFSVHFLPSPSPARTHPLTYSLTVTRTHTHTRRCAERNDSERVMKIKKVEMIREKERQRLLQHLSSTHTSFGVRTKRPSHVQKKLSSYISEMKLKIKHFASSITDSTFQDYLRSIQNRCYDNMQEEEENATATHKQLMTKRANELLEKFVSVQIKRESRFVKPQWKKIVTHISHLAVLSVSPNVSKGDQMDIRNYIKTKAIPGGRMEDCEVIHGLVFKKHLVHRSMKRRIENPKIILISGSINFSRREKYVSSLSSLEILHDQETHHIRMLVTKICSLNPDIVLVTNGVAKVGQDMLHERGVSLAVNVKERIIKRLSRLSGARILSHVDHIDLADSETVLGTYSLSLSLSATSPSILL